MTLEAGTGTGSTELGNPDVTPSSVEQRRARGFGMAHGFFFGLLDGTGSGSDRHPNELDPLSTRAPCRRRPNLVRCFIHFCFESAAAAAAGCNLAICKQYRSKLVFEPIVGGLWTERLERRNRGGGLSIAIS